MEIQDISGLGKATEKLSDLLAKMCGTLYRPRSIRKEADAEAYRYKALERAKAEAEVERDAILNGPPLLTVAEGRGGDSNGPSTLIARSQQRLQLESVRKQVNLESVILATEMNLGSDTVSDEPVDETWATRFFGYAEEVSDAQMQDAWGRLLAGEIAKPGTFSLRAMDTLRNLTKTEADLFADFVQHSFDGWLPQAEDGTGLPEFGLSIHAILKLRSAGLLHDSNLTVSEVTPFTVEHNKKTVNIVDTRGVVRNINFPAYVLTNTGCELAKLVAPASFDEDYRHIINARIMSLIGCTIEDRAISSAE